MRTVIALVLYLLMVWLIMVMMLNAIVKQDEARDEQRNQRKIEHELRTTSASAARMAER